MSSNTPATTRTVKSGAFGIPGCDLERLRAKSLLACGLGNGGQPFVMQLAPYVGRIKLVDRERVEAGNLANQSYAGY